MLYDDSVRVPENAAPGKATLRVELISTTGKTGKTTDLPVTLEKGEEPTE